MSLIARVLASRRMLVTLFLGFSSGLPLLAVGSTLQAWMKYEHVDLSIIGIYALVGLPYTLKFLWAPFLDRYAPPFLGRRRGWILISQLALMVSLTMLALTRPAQQPWLVAMVALVVSFCGATQDIVLDAHRRDTLHDRELGLGSALFVNGYRIGMLISGAMALTLADRLPWRSVYMIVSAFMLVGIVANLLAPEPEKPAMRALTLRAAVVEPFLEFCSRRGWLVMLSFVLLYKIGDSMASSMTTPFILEIGFSMTQLAAIVKTFGLVALIAGGLIGGGVMVRTGINRALWIFGIMQASSILTFMVLAQAGNSLPLLAFAVAAENLSFGMGTTAYVAYMASICDRRFSATQYALLSSLMGVPRVLASTPTGYLAKALGWPGFFVFCAALAIPGMLLLLKVAPWNGPGSGSNGEAAS